MNRRHFLKAVCVLALVYGMGRVYFATTDGFSLQNITYDLPFEVRREVKTTESVDAILDQPFTYLGKGCQSYVFLSGDGQYVLKFFKFQRYRPQSWLKHFYWVPYVEEYSQERLAHKKQKLDTLFSAWKTAYEDLPYETGLLFVKLSSHGNFNRTLTFYDKIGLKYEVNLDEMQFLIQRKADMFTTVFEQKLQAGDRVGARQMLVDLVDLFLSEYKRGYADLDPAIIQNTGFFDGRPIHVDVGQIAKTGDQFVWKKDLFNKTYKFRLWLAGKDRELSQEFDARIEGILNGKD